MQILIRIQLLFKCGSGPGSSFKNFKNWPYEEFSVIKKKQLLKKQNNRASENLLVCFYFINLIECGSGSRRENACRSMRIRSLENLSLYSYTINLPAGPGRALMWQPPVAHLLLEEWEDGDPVGVPDMAGQQSVPRLLYLVTCAWEKHSFKAGLLLQGPCGMSKKRRMRKRASYVKKSWKDTS